MATTVPSAADLPLAAAYDDRDRDENFPVAMRMLPADIRDTLRRIYTVVRHIDDLGDEADGDRAALLRAFDDDLGVLESGRTPRSACLRALAPAVRERSLPVSALHDLVRANLRDQQVSRYETFDDLLGYCALSAAPVGRLVLATFGRHDASLFDFSDRICSALQVLEHCQDVAEDLRAGRIYLPHHDLRAAGVHDDELCASRHRDALRAVVLVQVDRAEAMMERGRPLVGRLHGWARVAVAGYLAGGLATAAALRRADGEVVQQSPRPGAMRTLGELVHLLLTAGGARC